MLRWIFFPKSEIIPLLAPLLGMAGFGTGVAAIGASIGLPVASEVVAGEREVQALDLETQMMLAQLRDREMLAGKDVALAQQYAAAEEGAFRRQMPHILGEMKAAFGASGVELEGTPEITLGATSRVLQSDLSTIIGRGQAEVSKQQAVVSSLQAEQKRVRIAGEQRIKHKREETIWNAISAGFGGAVNLGTKIAGFFL